MRILALLCVVGVVGCAHLQESPDQSHNWAAYDGTWAFQGMVEEGTARTQVSGTVHLEDGWYWVEATHGRCDDRMPMIGGPTLQVRCPGIRLDLRTAGGSFDVVGHASIEVQEMVERRVCTAVATEQPTCSNMRLPEDVQRRARVDVSRVAEVADARSSP